MLVWYHGVPGLTFDATLSGGHCPFVAAPFTNDAVSNVVFLLIEVELMAKLLFHSTGHTIERKPEASFSCFIKNKGLASEWKSFIPHTSVGTLVSAVHFFRLYLQEWVFFDKSRLG